MDPYHNVDNVNAYNAKNTLQNFQTPNNALNAQCLHLLKILVPTTLNADNATMHTMLKAYVYQKCHEKYQRTRIVG